MKTTPIGLLNALLLTASLLTACDSAPDEPQNDFGIRMLESPVSAGSQGANFSVGGDGTVIMSWLQREGESHALQFSLFSDGAWSNPRTVTSGDNWFVNWADFPSVVRVSEELWAAHWLERRAAGGYAYDIRAAFSSDQGKTWSAPFTPHTDGTDTEHGFVTIFPDHGEVGMLWLDGRKMVNEYDENDVGASGMTLRTASFDRDGVASNQSLVDDLICDCCQTDVTVTPDGPVAVYRDRTTAEIRDIYLARRIDGLWQPGATVGADNWEIPGCPVNGPVIQSRGNRIAVAWFSASNGQPRVQAAWSDDAGYTMSAPVMVASGELHGHVGAAMLPDGRLAVTWLASTGNGSAALHVRRVADDGAAGPDVVIAEAAGVAPFSVPQVVYVGESLLLAWTYRSGDDSRVTTATLPLELLD